MVSDFDCWTEQEPAVMRTTIFPIADDPLPNFLRHSFLFFVIVFDFVCKHFRLDIGRGFSLER